MTGLSWIYYGQGRYEDGEKLSGAVLALLRDVLGDRHPDTIWSMSEVASTHYGQGRYEEAEKLSAEVLAVRRDVLGDKHPDTLMAMYNLAFALHGQQRHSEAFAMMMECWRLQRVVLGRNHPAALNTRQAFGLLFGQMGKRTRLARWLFSSPESLATLTEFFTGAD